MSIPITPLPMEFCGECGKTTVSLPLNVLTLCFCDYPTLVLPLLLQIICWKWRDLNLLYNPTFAKGKALFAELQGEQLGGLRASHSLRKAECKLKAKLTCGWRTSTATVVFWSSSFVTMLCLINRTRCISPFSFLPHRHKEACVGEYGQGVLIIYVPVHQLVIVGAGPRASWR